jgi:hypothetical protein
MMRLDMIDIGGWLIDPPPQAILAPRLLHELALTDGCPVARVVHALNQRIVVTDFCALVFITEATPD